MDEFNVYRDLALRTNKEFRFGVVGPVRTGKSTFIRRFMELMILPYLDEKDKAEATDEIPVSGSGRLITTVEPKFIPKNPASIILRANNKNIDSKIETDNIKVNVRMIDCVGYMVDSASGAIIDGQERLVKTPWFDYDIPFSKAAEIGTKKVINDHSTIGIVVTTDGSFGDIEREAFLEAEERTIDEIKGLNKPYVVILNSAKPNSEETINLANEIKEKYKTEVIPTNCEQLKKIDIIKILEAVLLEFPISMIAFNIPKWVEALESNNEIKNSLVENAKNIMNSCKTIKDIHSLSFSKGASCIIQI